MDMDMDMDIDINNNNDDDDNDNEINLLVIHASQTTTPAHPDTIYQSTRVATLALGLNV